MSHPSFDYASRDYSTIRTDLLARAKRVLPEWTDRDPSDFGMLLVDLWSYSSDILHYYIDRAAQEAFVPTATQRESLLALASLFGYTPGPRTSAVGTVSLTSTATVDMTLSQYTEFTGTYGGQVRTCYTPPAAPLASGATSEVTVYEGSVVNPETVTDSASGLSAQRYTLSNAGVIPSSVDVYVYENGTDPVPYFEVVSTSTAVAGQRVYSLSQNADGYTEVVFGSESLGFPPPANSKIEVTYAYSSGASGNLPANVFTAFKNTTPANVSVAGSSTMIGGVDDESMDSIRSNITATRSTGGRAVTANDFVNLALQIPNIGKAYVSYTAGGASANGSVTVYAHPDRSTDFVAVPYDATVASASAQTLTATEVSDIQDYLQDRALLGVDVVCSDTIPWDGVDITIDLYLNDRAVISYAVSEAEAALDELFKFENVDFDTSIPLGAVYRAVLDIEGVDYAVVSLFNKYPSTGVVDVLTPASAHLLKKRSFTVGSSGGISGT